ncbi:hypothetical protein ABZ128_09530 [Streptomyces sp. NPDC006326]|uniref:hypothetical protein n=1 Tax=Streptomyces sp. NPDC006326 TaxID=3156752 RepID=UPI0033B8CEF2
MSLAACDESPPTQPGTTVELDIDHPKTKTVPTTKPKLKPKPPTPAKKTGSRR